jgi:hypothetical protein
MVPHKKKTVFFDADIIDTDIWKMKQLGQAARELISSRPELFAFINSDDEDVNSYLITVAHTLNKPVFIYKASIIDEDTAPYLTCIFKDLFQKFL